jgi:hypothetical protein
MHDTPPPTREHTMAILLLSNSSGTVTAAVSTSPAPSLPPAGRTSTLLPVRNLGDCGDCGSELAVLVNDKGEVRTTFCEYCEYGF